MFRVQVADDFPAPAVFIGALKMFAGVNGPEYISRLAFVIYRVYFSVELLPKPAPMVVWTSSVFGFFVMILITPPCASEP